MNKNNTLLIIFLMAFPSSSVFAAAGEAAQFIDGIGGSFSLAVDAWKTPLKNAAMYIMGLLLTISLAFKSIKLVLAQADIQEFVTELILFIFMAGLGFWLIQNVNYLANVVMNGWVWLGGQAGQQPISTPGGIFERGMQIFQLINKQADGMVIGIVHGILGIIVTLIYFLITLIVMLVEIQAEVVTAAGIIMLAFFGSPWADEYAKNYLRFWMSVGIQLFVMYLIVATGDKFITQWAMDQNYSQTESIMYLFGVVFIIFGLVWKIPAMVGGLVTGQNSMGSASVGSVAKQSAQMVTGAIAGGVATGMAMHETAKKSKTAMAAAGRAGSAMANHLNRPSPGGAIGGEKRLQSGAVPGSAVHLAVRQMRDENAKYKLGGERGPKIGAGEKNQSTKQNKTNTGRKKT